MRLAVATPLWMATALTPLIDAAYVVGNDGLISAPSLIRGAILVWLAVSVTVLVPSPPPLATRSLLLLAVYAGCASLFNPSASTDLSISLRYAFIGMVIWAAKGATLARAIDERWLTRTAAFSACLTVASILAGMYLGVTSDYGDLTGLKGVTHNVSVTASQLVAATPPLAALPLQPLSALARLALLGVTAASLRRSAILAVLVAFMAADLARRAQRLRAAMLFALGLPAGLFVLGTLGVGDALHTRVADLDLTQESAGSGRSVFWRLAVDDLQKRDAMELLIGRGPEHLAAVLNDQYGMAIGAHQDVLDIVSAWGIIGVLLLTPALIDLGDVARLTLNAPPTTRAAAAATVAVIVILALVTGGALQPTMALTYATVGLLLARRQ